MNSCEYEWFKEQFQSSEQRFADVMSAIQQLIKEIKQMATTQAQFDALLTQQGQVLGQLQALITSEDTSLTTVLADLQQLITMVQNGATPADLTSEATAIQSEISSLTANVTDLTTQNANLAAAATAAGAVITPPAASASAKKS